MKFKIPAELSLHCALGSMLRWSHVHILLCLQGAAKSLLTPCSQQLYLFWGSVQTDFVKEQ